MKTTSMVSEQDIRQDMAAALCTGKPESYARVMRHDLAHNRTRYADGERVERASRKLALWQWRVALGWVSSPVR